MQHCTEHCSGTAVPLTRLPRLYQLIFLCRMLLNRSPPSCNKQEESRERSGSDSLQCAVMPALGPIMMILFP